MADYTAHPLAWERDPIITPGDHGRADVASGRMAKWLRFNNPDTLVWITVDGRPYALTRNQANVYDAIRRLANTGVRATLRSLADELGVAASTVYRAAVKLVALGLLAYQSNRGRNGGYMFQLPWAGNDFDDLRAAARATLRRWRLAAEARISRLRVNVASMFPGRERELYQYRYTSPGMSATNTAWTVEQIREALGE